MIRFVDVVPAALVDLAIAQVGADLEAVRPRLHTELQLEFPVELRGAALCVGGGPASVRVRARTRRLVVEAR